MEAYRIGEILYEEDEIVLNDGKKSVSLVVANTGDRAVQVGSHFHFFECNFALRFDREAAFGRHLDIPSGTAVRFEPGEEKIISLVPYSGAQRVMGFHGFTMGPVDDSDVRARAMSRMTRKVKAEAEAEAAGWRAE
ncbi:MAG: urease subunit beta [Clostridiales Family XIII bacterium]|jgi:urease beta subunit|nr:urease subunit beta [Clostridiales Family XIII bacterium]